MKKEDYKGLNGLDDYSDKKQANTICVFSYIGLSIVVLLLLLSLSCCTKEEHKCRYAYKYTVSSENGVIDTLTAYSNATYTNLTEEELQDFISMLPGYLETVTIECFD